jgi:N-acetylneuraminic acid mutarotase
MRWKKTILMAGCVATMVVAAALAPAAELPFPTNWQGVRAPMPYGFYWGAQTTYNGKIYIFGGNSDWNPEGLITLNTTFIYDPATDTWTRGANMPTARYLATATEVDGKIYVIGGRTLDASGSGGPVNVNEAYDPATDTWTTKAPIPQAIRGHAAGAYNGKVYVFGGNTGTYQKTVRIYNPATDSWSTGAEMPKARAYGQVVFVPSNNRFYYIGGDNGGSVPSKYYGNAIQYDPNLNAWLDPTANMIDKVSQFACTLDPVANKIYVFSGLMWDVERGEDRGTSVSVQVLDIATNTFSDQTSTLYPPSPLTRTNAAASYLNGKIYLTQGSVGGTVVDELDLATGKWYQPNAFIPTFNVDQGNLVAVSGKLYFLNSLGNQGVFAYDPATNEWSQTAAVNAQPRQAAVAAAANGKVIFSGGWIGTGTTGDTQAYDPESDSFETLAADPTAALWSFGDVVNGTLYVFGGSSTGEDLLTTARALDLTTNTWSSKAPLPAGIIQATATAIGSKIYICGGYDNSADNGVHEELLIYDTTTNTYSTGAAMPKPVYAAAAVAYNGKVVVYGGRHLYNQGGTIYYSTPAIIQVYDPASNTWSIGNSLYYREGHGAALIGNKLYAVGGSDPTFPENRLDIVAFSSAPPPPSLSLAPASQSIVVGATGTLTATISAPQATATAVTLTSSNPSIASVPSSVTIAAGETSASFVATAVAVGGPVTISATLPAELGGATATAQVTVTGITVALNPTSLSIQAGSSGNLEVNLSAAQPVPVVVALASSNSAVATVPASVTVPAGSLRASFAVTGVAAGSATVTATLPAALGGGSATAAVTVTQPPTETFRYLVPSVAHLPGKSGTKWRTDLAVVNRGSASANLTVTYYPLSGTAVTRTATLAAGATTEWRDILVSLFELGIDANTSGTLKIEANAPVGATSRTYNEKTATETFGQYYPAVAEPWAWGAGQVGVLPQLKKNAGFRTNVGVLNLGTAACEVEVKLFGADGSQLGNTVTFTVAGERWLQQNDIFAAASVASADIAYATVEAKTAGGKIWAYASVIDATTGDPTTIPLLASLGTTTRVVPSVAHAPGKAGTKWRTDVAAVNRNATPATLTLTFADYVGSAPVVRTAELAAGGTVEWRDILTSLFGYSDTASVKGTVTIASTVEVDVTSRTYNQKSATETFGQYYPALAANRAIHSNEGGLLPQLKKNAGFRTNVGAVNLGTAACTVLVRLFGADGSALGNNVTISLPPGKWVQQDDIFAAAGVGGADIAYAVVQVVSEGAVAWAYASVIDATTGDPTTIPLLYPPLGLF